MIHYPRKLGWDTEQRRGRLGSLSVCYGGGGGGDVVVCTRKYERRLKIKVKEGGRTWVTELDCLGNLGTVIT
jgi:hypothetical protein